MNVFHRKMKMFFPDSSGQVMILTVLMLGGTIVGATTIAGLLMLFQIRQTADIANSTKAFYAADSGIEWASYQMFKRQADDGTSELPGTTIVNSDGSEMAILSNGARLVKPTCTRKDLGDVACNTFLLNDPNEFSGGSIKARGDSANTSRAYQVDFQ
jgi:hypothetical protein